MPNKAAAPDAISDYSRDFSYTARGYRNASYGYRRVTTIIWGDELFDQIYAEAKKRGWSFSRMVRHLCEASIEGIE